MTTPLRILKRDHELLPKKIYRPSILQMSGEKWAEVTI